MLISGVSFNAESLSGMNSLQRASFVGDLIRECPGELVVFPEWSFLAYAPEVREAYIQLEDFELQYGWLAECSKKVNKSVVVGIPTCEGDAYFNSAFVISSQGEVSHRYDKRRPFFGASEDQVIRQGVTEQVVEILDHRIHLSICFDLRFFGVFDESCTPTPFACINLASWPSVRSDAWETLLKARAIELETNFIGVNRYDGNEYSLSSKGYDPLGAEIKSLGTWIAGEWVDTWELKAPDCYKVIGSRRKSWKEDGLD